MNPFDSVDIHQMAFDANNKTLYLANYNRHTIIRVRHADTVPLLPVNDTPWSFEILAGKDATLGPPGHLELPPMDAHSTTPTASSGGHGTP